MTLFKIVLVLVLLFSLGSGVLGDNTSLSTADYFTVGGDSKWQPKTLESWFEHLTLEEQVAIYMAVEMGVDVTTREYMLEQEETEDEPTLEKRVEFLELVIGILTKVVSLIKHDCFVPSFNDK